MEPAPLAVADALDQLVHQFADPLSFYREVIQNALDAGSQEVEIYLIGAGADAGTGRVRCRFRRDANFHVEVIPAQGRLVSRNDRSTLLSVGQPVAVLGTCAGMNLDVELINCRVEGLAAQRAE